MYEKIDIEDVCSQLNAQGIKLDQDMCMEESETETETKEEEDAEGYES